jgi:DNA-binding phage protein
MEVEKLRAVLSTMRLSVVAKESGVSVHSLRRLMKRDSQPRHEVVRKVTAYLQSVAEAVRNG